MNVLLTGTNFMPGATSVLVSGSGLAVNSVSVLDSTRLTANFIIDPAASIDVHDVVVTTNQGTSGSQKFTVSGPPPIVRNVLPNTATAGSSVLVTVTGANFVPRQTQLAISGPGITISNAAGISSAESRREPGVTADPRLTAPSSDSTTTIAVLVNIDPNTDPGIRFLTVTTPNGSTGGLTFTIMPPGSTSSILPASGLVGTSIPVTITGSNFVTGVTTLTTSTPGLHVNALNVSSPTTLTATITLDTNAVVGTQLLTVATNGVQSFVFFQVLPEDPPTLNQISPPSAVVGTTLTLTLKGTNLVPFGGLVTISALE